MSMGIPLMGTVIFKTASNGRGHYYCIIYMNWGIISNLYVLKEHTADAHATVLFLVNSLFTFSVSVVLLSVSQRNSHFSLSHGNIVNTNSYESIAQHFCIKQSI